MIRPTLADAASRCVDSYLPTPDGLPIDAAGDLRLVWRPGEATVRGTDPESVANWHEDLDVRLRTLVDHADLGPCPEGALHAALALYGLLPAAPRRLFGHSLGGQVAALIAALLTAAGHVPDSVILVDPPKSGGEKLRALLDHIPDMRVVRLAGSYVTDWPIFESSLLHAREPLIPVGDWTPNPVEAHSITRAAAWIAARDGVAIAA